MSYSRSHDAPYAEQQAARSAARALVADYLNDALVVLQYQGENLLGHEAAEIKKYDPQLLSSVIIAQAIDRHSEVVAREISLSAKRIGEAINEANELILVEQRTNNERLLCILECLEG